MDYKDILSEEIKKEYDTDYGVLRAYWATVKRMIEVKSDKQQIQMFLSDFKRAFGDFKMSEAIGDFKDAGLLNN